MELDVYTEKEEISLGTHSQASENINSRESHTVATMEQDMLESYVNTDKKKTKITKHPSVLAHRNDHCFFTNYSFSRRFSEIPNHGITFIS